MPGTKMDTTYSRTEKEPHLDTIHYELAMLSFCRAALGRTSYGKNRALFNVFLECYLLHYRNTAEFLSGLHHKEAKKAGDTSDLSTAKPDIWAGRDLTPEELTALQAPAKSADNKYFTEISQFLQHCTQRRFSENKFWNYHEMYEELWPAIDAFLHTFPSRLRG